MANKKALKTNTKAPMLLLVIGLFGIIGLITVQLSSAASWSDYFQQYRYRNTTRFSMPNFSGSYSGGCNANISTGNATAVGNNMYTSVTQTGGPSGVGVYNYTTSYNNTGGQRVIGC